jgi:hypothetical protein
VTALEILEASPAAWVSTSRDHHVSARGVGASTPVHGEGGAVSTGQCSRTAIYPASSLAAGVVARSFSALMEILRWIGVPSFLVLQVQLYRFRNQPICGLSRVHRVRAPQCSSAGGVFIRDLVAPKTHAKHPVWAKDPKVGDPSCEESVTDVITEGGNQG